MASYDEVKARLQAVFHEVFDDTSIELFDEMTAEDVDDWDSVNHITLVLSVEKEFGLKLKVGEIAKLNDVGAMIRMLMERVP
ncbi:acyl carrier protein [Paramagnetospirillum marisnigri]|uniref:Acyl carrier protein n=1 Tax=Paramagnetospirillum marisnigri TaxID=1285242 RepID=A0A178MKZ7_9PROT|nr:acyl carrier protein [Paramagnetospirillum marisnigri]OAN49223.1 acyl carrier protein [Paramagnetospirillum marisnigri]